MPRFNRYDGSVRNANHLCKLGLGNAGDLSELFQTGVFDPGWWLIFRHTRTYTDIEVTGKLNVDGLILI